MVKQFWKDWECNCEFRIRALFHALDNFDPRPWAKTIGIIDIITSLVGLFMLVCLEIMVLNLSAEVQYIKQSNVSTPQAGRVLSSSNTLNATFTCHCDCHIILNTIQETLQTALEPKGEIAHKVQLHRRNELNATTTLCEILITTNVDPYEKQGLPTPISHIVEDVIKSNVSSEFKLPTKQVLNHMSDDEAYARSNPIPIESGNVKKSRCIDYVRMANEKEVSSNFDNMQILFMIAAACSAVVGAFLYCSFHAKRIMLTVIFCMELVCIGVLILALVLLNHHSLCLLEYGGINPDGRHATQYVQTTMTVFCILYLAIFKFFTLALIVLFAVNVPKLKPPRRFTKPTDIPADFFARTSDDTKGIKGILKGALLRLGGGAAPVHPLRLSRRMSLESVNSAYNEATENTQIPVNSDNPLQEDEEKIAE